MKKIESKKKLLKLKLTAVKTLTSEQNETVHGGSTVIGLGAAF